MKARRTILLLVTVNIICGCGNLSCGGGGSSKDEPTWRTVAADIAGQTFLDAEKGVLFYAFDSLAYPGESVDLIAKLRSAKNFRELDGAEVGFYNGSTLLGKVRTNGDGVAKLAWKPPKAGDYHLTAKIVCPPKDDDYDKCTGVASPLLVAARTKNTKFVVIDLDHTVVDSSFLRVLTYGAKPMAESVRVTKRIAKNYSIIYLTHRPDLLGRKSKNWLRKNDYPPGPLLVNKLSQILGDSGKFKTARLKDVQKTFPNVSIGIGDKMSDAQAYVDNGLKAYLIPHYKDKPKDLRKTAKEIRKLNSRGRLNVVDGWKQIEEGIFWGKTYPPDPFAKKLQARADRLQAEKKAKKKKDKDDDDDD